LLLFLTSGYALTAQTLSAGDIAFIGYNTDEGTSTNDDFSFFTLVDIPGSEVIYFTEEGRNGFSNSWMGFDEGHFSWTAPSGGVLAGTVIYINESSNNTFTASTGVVSALLSGLSWSLDGGDQVLAYQSSTGARPASPTFIAGVHGEYFSTCYDASTGWSTSCAGPRYSALPTGLTNGVDCVALFPGITEQDNARYIGTLVGDPAYLRELINDYTNWIAYDDLPYEIEPDAYYAPTMTCVCAATSTVPTTTGSYQADCAVIDGDWTHYCDGSNLLLSLKTDGSGAVINPNDVSVNIGATTATFHTQDCGAVPACFIDLANGAAVFNRQWDVDPTVQPSSGNVGVRFYFTQGEYDGVNTSISGQGQTPLSNMDEMWFYKVTNESLGQFPMISDITAGDVLVLNNGVTPTVDEWTLSTKTMNSEYIAEYEVSSFSGGGGGGADAGKIPLPVELIDFRVSAISGQSLLVWSTASETNNRGFEVLHSLDGASWENIGFVSGRGNPYSATNYDFTHTSPTIGVNYYRLRQYDLDGSMTLLPIQTIQFLSGSTEQVAIFPNPVEHILHITNAGGIAQIYTLSGQLILQAHLPKRPVNTIDLSNLHRGVFQLVLMNEEGKKTIRRFVK